MKYREIKQKLEARGFKFDAFQSDYELPMLHYAHPTIKSSNWAITLQFSHDTVIPEDVEDGREYSFDEDWILDAEISTFETNIDISVSFMSDDTLDTCCANDENSIFLYGKDLYLVDRVLDLICDPYSTLNFAEEYAKKVVEFMDWVKSFIPQFKKLNLPHFTFRRNGNEDVLYSSIGLKFELDSLSGIWFYMDVLTWKMHGHIKIAPGFGENNSSYFSDKTSIKDFRTELGIQWQEHLWYKEKMKNVSMIPLSGDEVILKDGRKVKFSDL
jgi:hypothetical protein